MPDRLSGLGAGQAGPGVGLVLVAAGLFAGLLLGEAMAPPVEVDIITVAPGAGCSACGS